MKTIGIKLADGSFYPVLEEGNAKTYQLDLTTVKDGQTKVQIDLYRSENKTMEDAEYVDTLEVSNLIPHPNGEVELHLSIGLNENNELDAKVVDEETGEQSETSVTLVSRTLAEREEPANFEISETDFSESMADNQDDTETSASSLEIPEQPVEPELSVKMDDFTDDTDDSDIAPPLSEDLEEPFSFDQEIAKQKEEVNGADIDKTFDSETSETNSYDTNNEDFSALDIPDDDENFSLPDFAETEVFDEEKTPENSAPESEDFSVEDLPDMNEDMFRDFDETDTPKTETAGLTGYFDDPVFQKDPVFTQTDLDMPEEINFDTSDLDTPQDSSAPAMDFSDLYDEDSLENSEEDEKSKTKTPVIICVVCAIICIIATLLILFIIPSKYNLLKKNSLSEQETVISEVTEIPVQTEIADENAGITENSEKEDDVPVIVEAKEDEIVVADEVESVVPTPVIPEPEKAKDVTYRIKWGDTLWDIADAYYKNPWRYKKIAKYNNIKNPDLIISGTDILIPAE